MSLQIFRDDQGALRAYGGPEEAPLIRFLEGDVQEDATAVHEILEALDAVEKGALPHWERTGNAHTLTLRPGIVHIESEVDETADVHEMAPELLRRTLRLWLAFAVSSADENRDGKEVMRTSSWIVFCLAFAVLAAGAASSQPASNDGATAFVGATFYPVDGEPIENGLMVVEDGKITALGSAAAMTVPAGIETVDLTGKVVIPGLVDTHTHVGRVEGGDRSGPLHPEVRVLDAVDVRDPTFVKALAGGITTVNVMSGSGHLMSGQTVYLKIRREGTRIEDWTFCDDVLAEVCGGMKMANGTNSIGQKPFPGTRAKSAALVRELFVKALDYRRKLEAAEKGTGDEKGGKKPDRDLGLEGVLQVLDGERIVHFHTHRHNDILTILRLSREFGFTPVLHHVSDASLVAEDLAEAGISASITGIDSPGGKEEALHIGWQGPADLEKAGVAVAFNTDDGITDSRYFLRSGAMAMRYGMSREGALRGLTLTPAEMLDLDDRVGSLTAGKDADFVILSGDPFSVYTRVEETWVEGRKVFDLDNAEDRRVAVGGPGAYPAGSTHLHDAFSEWDQARNGGDQ